MQLDTTNCLLASKSRFGFLMEIYDRTIKEFSEARQLTSALNQNKLKNLVINILSNFSSY